MVYLIANRSALRHNGYLFMRKKNRFEKLTNKRYQGLQGPLLNEFVEITEEDIERVYVYIFRKGSLAATNVHVCIKLQKLYSEPSDWRRLMSVSRGPWRDYDYIRIKPSKVSDHILCTQSQGEMASCDFDVYKPGGMIVSLDPNPFHAIDIYNKFMRDKIEEYAMRTY